MFMAGTNKTLEITFLSSFDLIARGLNAQEIYVFALILFIVIWLFKVLVILSQYATEK